MSIISDLVRLPLEQFLCLAYFWRSLVRTIQANGIAFCILNHDLQLMRHTCRVVHVCTVERLQCLPVPAASCPSWTCNLTPVDLWNPEKQHWSSACAVWIIQQQNTDTDTESLNTNATSPARSGHWLPQSLRCILGLPGPLLLKRNQKWEFRGYPDSLGDVCTKMCVSHYCFFPFTFRLAHVVQHPGSSFI